MNSSSSVLWDTVSLLVNGICDINFNEINEKEKLKKKTNHNRLAPKKIVIKKKTAKIPTDSQQNKRNRIFNISYYLPTRFSYVERQMGSNIALFTDLQYMENLREKMLNDLNEKQKSRIKERKNGEKERQLQLIMNGIIDMADAPCEFHNHPIYKTVMESRKNIEQTRIRKHYPLKRNRNKFTNLQNNNYVKSQFNDDNKLDTNENENENLKIKEHLNIRFLNDDDMDDDDDDDDDVSLILSNYTNSTRFDSPEFKHMRSLKTVDELYSYADEIICQKKINHFL